MNCVPAVTSPQIVCRVASRNRLYWSVPKAPVMRLKNDPLPPVLIRICTVRRLPVHRQETVPDPSSGAGVDGLLLPKLTGVVATVLFARAARSGALRAHGKTRHTPPTSA